MRDENEKNYNKINNNKKIETKFDININQNKILRNKI